MSDKRIIELESISDVPADAYLVIDSVSGDTRKIKPIKIGATYEIEDGDHSFTLVGSNGYSHTVDIPYDSVSMTQAEYNALTPAQKADGTARFLTDAESDVESELWSKVGRQTLDTEAQVLSNAVNELVDKTDETNSDVAELNSSLTNKTYNVVLLRFLFNKGVNAGSDLEYSVSGTDLNALVNDEVISANVHLAGSTGQPIYISHSIVRTSISGQLYSPIISGHIYNPSTSNRTYAMEVECLVKRAFN